MTVTIQKENKNTAITVTNEVKGSDLTWAEQTGTWADQGKGTFARQRTVITNESKNTAVSINNESKN